MQFSSNLVQSGCWYQTKPQPDGDTVLLRGDQNKDETECGADLLKMEKRRKAHNSRKYRGLLAILWALPVGRKISDHLEHRVAIVRITVEWTLVIAAKRDI